MSWQSRWERYARSVEARVLLGNLLDRVARDVARVCGVTISEMRQRNPMRSAQRARNLAWWLTREMTGASFNGLGAAWRGFSHATVQHGIADAAGLVARRDHRTIATLSAVFAAAELGRVAA